MPVEEEPAEEAAAAAEPVEDDRAIAFKLYELLREADMEVRVQQQQQEQRQQHQQQQQQQHRRGGGREGTCTFGQRWMWYLPTWL